MVNLEWMSSRVNFMFHVKKNFLNAFNTYHTCITIQHNNRLNFKPDKKTTDKKSEVDHLQYHPTDMHEIKSNRFFFTKSNKN
jgi:hypothetical protein